MRLVTFSNNAQGRGDGWLTVGAARALMATLVASGGTNYDEALGDAIKLFDSNGKIDGAQNVSYFLSDGQPTFGSGSTTPNTANPDLLIPEGAVPSDSPLTNGTGQTNQTNNGDLGIQPAEEAIWRDFLDSKQVSSFALGFGGLSTADTALDPIAYDGRTGTDTNCGDRRQLRQARRGTGRFDPSVGRRQPGAERADRRTGCGRPGLRAVADGRTV